jgi:hypothetical protein
VANPSQPNPADEALIRAMRRELPKLPPSKAEQWNPKTKGAGKASRRGGKK